ncbi:MAG: hypothetical protein ACOC0V_01915 [Oceanicaulis sp.]
MRIVVVLLGASALYGCASGPLAGFDVERDCPLRPPSNIVLFYQTPDLGPGESITLTPAFTDRPGAFEDLPPACLTGATLSADGVASLDRAEDGSLVVHVREDAPEGNLGVSADYAALGRISGLIRIYDPEAAPLVGTWSQDAEACAALGAEPVRELVFQPGGRFAVTWTPFETYEDYWGDYAFERETGALTLSPERGNSIPGDVRSGAARLSEDGRMLTLETASFGSRRGAPVCDAPFRR